MNVRRQRLFAVFLATLIAVCLSPAGTTRTAQVRIPEGRNHFIVLVDASLGAVEESHSGADLEENNSLLNEAEFELADLLFSPGKVVTGRWYRGPKDYLTVVQTGIYPSNSDQPDGPFLRRTIWADTNVGRRRFVSALHPKQRPGSNSWLWSLPAGLSAAAIPGVSIQDTFVIVLSRTKITPDLTSFSGQLSGLNLISEATKNLEKKRDRLRRSVLLEGRDGIGGPLLARTIGEGSSQIALTAFHASSLSTQSAASSFLRSNPLESANLTGEGQEMRVDLDFVPPFIGESAKLSIHSGGTESAQTFKVLKHIQVRLQELSGSHGVLSLVSSSVASNPILGRQLFHVVYSRSILLPAGLRYRWLVGWFCVLAVCCFGFVRLYYRTVVRWRFLLWLPGYVSSFELPSLSERATSNQILRSIGENGDLAAVLLLPSPFIRSIFYRNTSLKWDPMLQLNELPNTAKAKLTELPTTVKLNWLDRP